MKIKFDIKYRQQIECGKYKVINHEGEPVAIEKWDLKGNYPILVILPTKVSDFEGEETWVEDRPFVYAIDGHCPDKVPSDTYYQLYMEDIKQIEEYEHQIELLKEEQKKIDKERENLQLRWCEINQEIYAFEKKINTIEIDRFSEECAKGLHKIVKYSDIPKGLWWERTRMFEKISGGCNGDWEVGCRGCEHDCGRKADEKFMQKYNIEKIVY